MTAADSLLHDELTLTPERTFRMLRMTALVTLVVTLSMALRVPDAAISAYMVFFVTKSDTATTVKVGVALVAGVTVALAMVFVFFSVTVADPALRLPLMALLIFGGMYFMRTSPVGALGLAIGFITAYSLTEVDQVRLPEELVRGLLWIWVVIAYPIALVVLANLAFGRRPDEVYRDGVAARLHAAGAALAATGASAPVAARRPLERFVRVGVADLVPYAKSGPPATAPLRLALLRQLDQLGYLVRELPPELARSADAQPALRRAGDACLGAERALVGGQPAPIVEFTLLADERRRLAEAAPATAAVVFPLIRCLQTVTLAVDELLRPAPAAAAAATSRPKPASPSAAKRTEAAQFALKVTLASMTAYLFYTGLAWFGIHTAMITCFFVAEDSLGATIHKLTLRLTGALVGAALGIGAIIVVLPRLETVGGLGILVAVVTLFAAWISTGSQRISYAGWQIAIAFYLTVLQGYSRTSHMVVGRDRVIGILLGNVLMTVVFTTLWPVRIRPAMRQALSRAAAALATMLRLAPDDRQRLDALETAFYGDVTAARQYAPLSRFEPGNDDRARIMTVIEELWIPVQAIVRDPLGVESAGARQALAPLVDQVAGWLTALSASIAAQRPLPALAAAAPAVAAFERALDDSPASHELRARLRLHVEWLELMRTQVAQLAERAPA